ncbi:MAG: hypothetical protein B0D91_05425 [Oceanospirillales bacterium LUC14_002_19_P2]|nr:MAG: hypothetical protein B0D91_05425 [Oceanospirillales bacterium LUC14_002_19_P2]
METRLYAPDRDGRDRLKSRVAGRQARKTHGASRLEDRQASVRRWTQRGAQAAKLLLAGMVIGAFVWSLPLLWNWLDRPIISVKVEGEFRYLPKETVEQQVTPFLAERFFRLDVAGLQTALQSVPWISRAKVRKIWPETLSVRIQEQVPVARWKRGGVLNGDGEVFRVNDLSRFSDLPLLYGKEAAAPQVMQQYMTLNQQIRPLGLAMTALGQRETGSWWFQIGDVEVNLGHRDLVKRMQRFVRLYHVLLQKQWQDVRRVDLRYRDGIAVSWNTNDGSRVNRSN